MLNFLKYASNSLSRFDQEVEHVIRESKIALTCYECEDHMQKGIESYQWIDRLDAGLRAAHLEGLSDVSPSDFDCVRDLYRRWHENATRLESLISMVKSNGHELDEAKSTGYNCCREAVAAWLEIDHWQSLETPESDDPT